MGREPAEILTARISVRPTEPHLTRPLKKIYIPRAHDAKSCYLKVGEQYGKPTLSLPFGGLQNKCGACAGLTPDQPARHIDETRIIKGREFPLRLRNDERTVDRGAWGTHSAPGVRHPEEKLLR